MKYYERSKSGLFLMELLINLLLFCVLCGCGLMFFIKAHHMTQNTTDLHHAVRITTSIAGIYESGNGSLSLLYDIYPAESISKDMIAIYFDQAYNPCSSSNYAYKVLIEKTNGSIEQINIVFYNENEEAIYTLDAFHYTPSTLKKPKEVSAS